ncbi:MAG: tetratricopeptide repeat protein [Egibacteraceae bacterium]
MGSWRQAGRVLAGLRERRVWSIPRFAEELEAKATVVGRAVPGRDSLVRMVREWEAGDHRPRDYAVLFVLIYATDAELSVRTIGRGSELDRLMAAFKAMGVPVNRRKFLLDSAAIAAGVAVGPSVPGGPEAQERLAWTLQHPASVDLKTVAHLRDTAVDLLGKFASTPSPTLLYSASKQLEHVTSLRQHAPSDRIREQLYEIEAHSATLLGQIIWDALCRCDYSTAAHYYEQAVEASTHVKGGWAEALPRVQQCLIAIYHDRDPKRALDLASRAAACAGDGSSSVLAGEPCLYVGEAHALLGEKRECERALDYARSHLQNAASDDPALGRFSMDWVGGFAGACHLHLGDPKSAELVLLESAQSLGAGKEIQKVFVLGDLAIALIRQGDPEQATAVLHQAIGFVELGWSGGGVQRVLMAGRELLPWIGEPFVQDAQDRLLALMLVDGRDG